MRAMFVGETPAVTIGRKVIKKGDVVASMDSACDGDTVADGAAVEYLALRLDFEPLDREEDDGDQSETCPAA